MVFFVVAEMDVEMVELTVANLAASLATM